RYVYLRRRGSELVVSPVETPLGPIRNRRLAERAARALRGAHEEELAALPLGDGPLPRLRERMSDLADSLRYEEAARLRDRLAAFDRLLAPVRRLDRLRDARLCLVAPALEPGWREAFFVAGGRVCVRRRLPPGPGARLELEAGRSAALAAAAGPPSLAPE